MAVVVTFGVFLQDSFDWMIFSLQVVPREACSLIQSIFSNKCRLKSHYKFCCITCEFQIEVSPSVRQLNLIPVMKSFDLK